jgi:hypothetical protein
VTPQEQYQLDVEQAHKLFRAATVAAFARDIEGRPLTAADRQAMDRAFRIADRQRHPALVVAIRRRNEALQQGDDR